MAEQPSVIDLSSLLVPPAAGFGLPDLGPHLSAEADALRAWLASRTAAIDALCRWLERPRVLLGLLRRPAARRLHAARTECGALGLISVIGEPTLHVLMRRRVLFGLLRRPRATRRLMVPGLVRRTRDELADQALAGLGSVAAQLAAAIPLPAAPTLPVLSFAEALARCTGSMQIFDHAAFPGPLVAAGFRHATLPAGAAPRWVARMRRGWALPATPGDLRAAAEEVLVHPLFDAADYSARTGLITTPLSAAIHYLLLGDPLGIPPSAGFDPVFYAERYPDIDAPGMSRLLHFIRDGQREGRAPLPFITAPHRRVPTAPDRETILLIVHEASRTGAPILGWNLARQFAGRYNVVVLLLGGGPLTEEFAAAGAQTHGPLPPDRRDPVDLAWTLRALVGGRHIRYAIVNSVEARATIAPLHALGIRTVLLVHEFASYVYDREGLCQAIDRADEIVFPARLVADSALAVHPALHRRRLRIHPQGQCVLPPAPRRAAPPPRAGQLGAIAMARRAGCFTVLGAGTVTYRKGVDLFIATAAILNRTSPRPVQFVWVGHGYAPDADMAYSIYLREQIERSGLQKCVVMLDEVPDLEPLYAAADAFFLASRLDPLPNVGIDAAIRGLPMVCFGGASGAAEVMAADPQTASGVVDHLDPAAAARALLSLATDPQLHARTAAASLRHAASVFDMAAYSRIIDGLGAPPALAQIA